MYNVQCTMYNVIQCTMYNPLIHVVKPVRAYTRAPEDPAPALRASQSAMCDNNPQADKGRWSVWNVLSGLGQGAWPNIL